jgi:mRNA interferase RelE/StbE
MTRPEVYSRPLRWSLKGYRKLKVGDYRIVLKVEDKLVKVFAIQHSSVVYETAPKRL